jgi:hypothetical protein
MILGWTLGSAAWNGVNLAVAVYLVCSFVGSVGLLVALIASASRRRLFVWMSGTSAFAIACVALVFILGFLFRRDSGVPINEPVGMFGVHGPLLAFYGFSLVSCFVEVLLSIFRYRQLKVLR